LQRFGLRDDQWERIKDFLPGREGHVGGTAADNRLFVDAVLYRYRTGIPWRDLPARFGDWKNVHQRFGRWGKERCFRARMARSDPGPPFGLPEVAVAVRTSLLCCSKAEKAQITCGFRSYLVNPGLNLPEAIRGEKTDVRY
jgi:hypothetical protein